MAPSDTRESSVAPATADNKKGDKAAKPDFFYGDRNKVDDWFNQLYLYFHLEGFTSEQRKSLFAASYMRGEAQH